MHHTRHHLPAEACTELGAEPAHRAAATARHSKAGTLALLLCVLALYGLAGALDAPAPEALAALPEHLPSDGFPPELLAVASQPAASAANSSEAGQ